MSSNDPLPSQRSSSDEGNEVDAQIEVLKLADADLAEAALRIMAARKRLAAADRKYRERMRRLAQ